MPLVASRVPGMHYSRAAVLKVMLPKRPEAVKAEKRILIGKK